MRHLLILGMCAYTLQAIATADGAFRLNHDLFFATKDNAVAGWQRTLAWMDTSANSIDKWSIERFGKDPWLMQGEMLAAYTTDCVSTPSNGGYASPEKINVFHNAKKKNLDMLGTPLCKAVSGDLRYLTKTPGVMFQVNPQNPKQYGSVRAND